MSRGMIGILLVIVAAIAMIINMLILRTNEYYDLIRITSFLLFIVGSSMIPTFSKSSKREI